MKLTAVILAAGVGTRMKSNKPKAMQTLAGKELIKHVISALNVIKADEIIVVCGHLQELLKESLQDERVTFVEQKEQLGTGHALLECLPYISDNSNVLILYGDVPLISPEVLYNLVSTNTQSTLGVITASIDNPFGLGRIVRDKFGTVEEIVEEKDATDLQKQIKEINTGIYSVPKKLLQVWLPKIGNDNANKEYYLTDIIKFARADNISINVTHPIHEYEILGVNTRVQLADLERRWQRSIANKIMRNGVSIADPYRFDVRGHLTTGKDCWIDVNVIFKGDVKLGDGVVVGANCILKNCEIKDNVKIKANTMVDDSIIESNAIVGPFARIRPQSHIKENSVVGNFVEIKKSTLGEGSKASHLTYLGDTTIGKNVNIGAGVITCNYDGVNKYKTIIGDDVFVGSDTQLIAPVKVADGATIGAGSTITQNVQEDVLAISRARQRHITDWKHNKKEESKNE